MLSEPAQAALIDIRHNILAARRFMAGLSFKDFATSDLHSYAVMRALEIISEASRRLPADFRQAHNALPWKQIMGIGKVLRHDYDSVIEAIIWATVHEHLAPLLAMVEAELDHLP